MHEKGEAHNPQLNIRPGGKIHGRVAVMAAVNGISISEQARLLLDQATTLAFEAHPELATAHEAFETARQALHASPDQSS